MREWDYLLVDPHCRPYKMDILFFGGGAEWGTTAPGSGLTLIRAKNGRLLGPKRLSIVLIKANTKYQITGH